MFEYLVLDEWNGIVLDTEPGTTLEKLQRERARVGSLTLWEYQSFRHHEHPFFSQAEEENAKGQNEARHYLLDKLHSSFPQLPFVVETEWFSVSTWYQATEDAPSEDEDWQDLSPGIGVSAVGLSEMAREEAAAEMQARIAASRTAAGGTGRKRNCPFCQACEWSEGYETPELRGIRWMDCKGCGRRSVEASKIIRDRIGPDEVFVVPEVP